MSSLVITFDETKERLYKVSIQENKTSKGQKRARAETELPVQISIFQRMTPATPTTKVPSIVVKPFKKPVSQKLWVSSTSETLLAFISKNAKA